MNRIMKEKYCRIIAGSLGNVSASAGDKCSADKRRHRDSY